jgi:peptidoglycan-N-acetylglucosamine deacetylase
MAIAYGDPTRNQEVIFTFDDGPNPATTPKLLDILRQHEIKATFFVVGERLETQLARDIMLRAYKEGHHIGNHTYTHTDLRTLPTDRVREELNKTQLFIDACGPKTYKLMRPPYGALNRAVRAILHDMGYTVVLWNVDTLDWKLRSSAWVDHGWDQINARQHSLVLMHDIHKTTVDNVEQLILKIKGLPSAEFQLYA